MELISLITVLIVSIVLLIVWRLFLKLQINGSNFSKESKGLFGGSYKAIKLVMGYISGYYCCKILLQRLRVYQRDVVAITHPPLVPQRPSAHREELVVNREKFRSREKCLVVLGLDFPAEIVKSAIPLILAQLCEDQLGLVIDSSKFNVQYVRKAWGKSRSVVAVLIPNFLAIDILRRKHRLSPGITIDRHLPRNAIKRTFMMREKLRLGYKSGLEIPQPRSLAFSPPSSPPPLPPPSSLPQRSLLEVLTTPLSTVVPQRLGKTISHTPVPGVDFEVAKKIHREDVNSAGRAVKFYVEFEGPEWANQLFPCSPDGVTTPLKLKWEKEKKAAQIKKKNKKNSAGRRPAVAGKTNGGRKRSVAGPPNDTGDTTHVGAAAEGANQDARSGGERRRSQRLAARPQRQ